MRNDVKNDNQKKNMTKKTRRKQKIKKKEGKQKQQNEMKRNKAAWNKTNTVRGQYSKNKWNKIGETETKINGGKNRNNKTTWK